MPEEETFYNKALANVGQYKTGITILGLGIMIMVYLYKLPFSYIIGTGITIAVLFIIGGTRERISFRDLEDAEKIIQEFISRFQAQPIPYLGWHTLRFNNFKFNKAGRIHEDPVSGEPKICRLGLNDINPNTAQPDCYAVDVYANPRKGKIMGFMPLGTGKQYEYKANEGYYWEIKDYGYKEGQSAEGDRKRLVYELGSKAIQ